jgi:hypothetical protein
VLQRLASRRVNGHLGLYPFLLKHLDRVADSLKLALSLSHGFARFTDGDLRQEFKATADQGRRANDFVACVPDLDPRRP